MEATYGDVAAPHHEPSLIASPGHQGKAKADSLLMDQPFNDGTGSLESRDSPGDSPTAQDPPYDNNSTPSRHERVFRKLRLHK